MNQDNSIVVQAGDVVRLKSGGPTMVVEWVAEHLADPFVRCIWFDQRKVKRMSCIRTVALTLALRPPD